MTYEVQQTRWDRIIRRVSGSIGPGSRVAETLSELFPVLDVENVPPELLILGGTGICHGGGTIASIAGEGATAQLFNPEDSGTLLTLTGVYVAFLGATSVRWGTTRLPRGTEVSTEQFRDLRRFFPNSPIGQVRQESAVALAIATNQTLVLSSTNLHLEDHNSIAVLDPGAGFEIGNGAGANTLFYGFYWRERPVEESELSL